MRVNLVVPVGVEEGGHDPFALLGREAGRRRERQFQGGIREAALDVARELPQKHRRQVNGEVHVGVALQQGRHGIVVPERVQPHPREQKPSGGLGAQTIEVERLMLMPQQRQKKPRPHPGLERPGGRLTLRGATHHRILNRRAGVKRAQLGAPIAVRAAVGVPRRARLARGDGAPFLNPPIDLNGLFGLNRPSADLQVEPPPAPLEHGSLARVSGLVPHPHGSGWSRSVRRRRRAGQSHSIALVSNAFMAHPLALSVSLCA